MLLSWLGKQNQEITSWQRNRNDQHFLPCAWRGICNLTIFANENGDKMSQAVNENNPDAEKPSRKNP